MNTQRLLETVGTCAQSLAGADTDYDGLVAAAEGRDFVLLGEASHGTAEFYRMRAEITRRLIEELDFDAVAVEADWPDALRVNHYVLGRSDEDARAAFDDFERFPEWMWRNHEVLALVRWLRERNGACDPDRRAGFYGLDLYSLYSSARAVIAYLEKVDPAQAAMARRRYGCLAGAGEPQTYGYQVAFKLRRSCEDEVIDQLIDLRRHAGEYLARDGEVARDQQFFAERNAKVVRNAESYYRAMFGSRVNTWNLRDEHMADTLFALQRHLRDQGRHGRIVVWAHNSHLGDARATEMGERGDLNLGQLVRQEAGPDQALLVGFTTHTGYVSAAHDWAEPVHHMKVRPSLEGSWERLFHDAGGDFWLPVHALRDSLSGVQRLQRMIGVIYRPETERHSHYFHCRLGDQFDGLFHIDTTHAVEPLDTGAHWVRPEDVELAPHPTVD